MMNQLKRITLSQVLTAALFCTVAALAGGGLLPPEAAMGLALMGNVAAVPGLRQKRMYAEICKTEAQEDGTIKVWGYASSGAKDSDDETITPEAMKAALPDYMKFGAVREMHQPSAAGTALEASVDEAGKTWFGAHVVDPIAVKKVETKVYKGFSIGGKVTGRDPLNKTIITGLNLVEVSLVDRPANPEAVITVFKAEKTQEDHVNELAELLDSGVVTPEALVAMAKAAAAAPAQVAAPVVPVVATPAVTAEGVAEPTSTEAPVAVKAAAGTDLKKGLWSVGTFADILCNVGYLAQDAACEADWEGDASPVPAQLKEWFAQGAAIFQSMAAEETAEMLEGLNAMVAGSAGASEKAAKAALAKAGTKFSAATKTVLADVHKMLTDGCAKMAGLGYDTGEEKAATVDKAASVAGDTIGIVDEAITKALAPLREQVETLTKANTGLQQELESVKKRAAPGKALLKAVSLSKAADSAPDADPAEAGETPPPEGTAERAEYEMRKVMKSGGRSLTRLA